MSGCNFFHDKLGSTEDNHGIVRWEFADSAERLAATGFTSDDKFKVAVDLDTFTHWSLIDPAARTWKELTNDTIPEDLDVKVAASATDNQPGTLDNKLSSGGSIGLSLDNAGPTQRVKITSAAEINAAANVGDGAGLYKDKSNSVLRFKTLKATGLVTITPSADVLTFTTTAQNNDGQNVGAGIPVYKQKSGSNIQIRSLAKKQSSSPITLELSPDQNSILFDTTAEPNAAENLGNLGASFYKAKNQGLLQFRKVLSSDSSVQISETANHVDFKVSFPPSGQNNTGENVGSGVGVYKEMNEAKLRLKSFRSSDNSILIDAESDTINLRSQSNLINVTGFANLPENPSLYDKVFYAPFGALLYWDGSDWVSQKEVYTLFGRRGSGNFSAWAKSVGETKVSPESGNAYAVALPNIGGGCAYKLHRVCVKSDQAFTGAVELHANTTLVTPIYASTGVGIASFANSFYQDEIQTTPRVIPKSSQLSCYIRKAAGKWDEVLVSVVMSKVARG